MKKSKLKTKTIMMTLLIALFTLSIFAVAPVMAIAETTLVADGPQGTEDRIVIEMPAGFTLGELESISWQEYLVTGYPPHVDVFIDADADGDYDDALVFEYAYNGHIGEGQPTYGALTEEWYATFSDDGNGPAVITGTAKAWPTTGPAGGPSIQLHTLAEWKAGITPDVSGVLINADSIILKLEIEVDNWIIDTEARVKNIAINDIAYNSKEYVLWRNGVPGKGIANAPGLQKPLPNENFAKAKGKNK